MNHRRRQRIHHRMHHESTKLHFHHEKRSNLRHPAEEVAVQWNDTLEVRVDIPVTMTRPHSGWPHFRSFQIEIEIYEKSPSTYSISNYPSSFDIGPPSRFQDVSCDSSYEKRDKNTNSPRVRGNQKFQREAFQINVWFVQSFSVLLGEEVKINLLNKLDAKYVTFLYTTTSSAAAKLKFIWF